TVRPTGYLDNTYIVRPFRQMDQEASASRLENLPRQESEAQTSLQFDDTACECALRLAEQRITRLSVSADDRIDAGQIGLVQNIVGVHLQIESRLFSEHARFRKTERLAKSRIESEEARTAKTVAADARCRQYAG